MQPAVCSIQRISFQTLITHYTNRKYLFERQLQKLYHSKLETFTQDRMKQPFLLTCEEGPHRTRGKKEECVE